VTGIFSLSRQETESTVSLLRGVDKQHKVSQLVFSVLKAHNSDAFSSVFYTKRVNVLKQTDRSVMNSVSDGIILLRKAHIDNSNFP